MRTAYHFWKTTIAALVALIWGTLAASAAVVTLTFGGTMSEGDYLDLPEDERPAAYHEQGVTVFPYPLSYTANGKVHADDAGTGIWDSYSIRSSQPFSVLSIDISGLGQNFYLENPCYSSTEPFCEDPFWIKTPYDNVLFQGYAGTDLVATQRYSTGLDAGTLTLLLGPDFKGLNTLVISAVTPDFASIPFPGGECVDYPCGHFDFDNLRLDFGQNPVAPVPLPASAPLLLAGLATLAAIRRRAERSTRHKTAIRTQGNLAASRHARGRQDALRKPFFGLPSAGC